jgi:hypothetical protein
MGQFFGTLNLIPPAPWLRVVGSFRLGGRLMTAPASLLVLLALFRDPFNLHLRRSQVAGKRRVRKEAVFI